MRWPLHFSVERKPAVISIRAKVKVRTIRLFSMLELWKEISAGICEFSYYARMCGPRIMIYEVK